PRRTRNAALPDARRPGPAHPRTAAQMATPTHPLALVNRAGHRHRQDPPTAATRPATRLTSHNTVPTTRRPQGTHARGATAADTAHPTTKPIHNHQHVAVGSASQVTPVRNQGRLRNRPARRGEAFKTAIAV